MLEVVARNPYFDSSKKQLSKDANLKIVEKKSRGTRVSVNTRYLDLYDAYIMAYEVATNKLEVKIQAFMDYQKAQDEVYRIRQEMNKLENSISLYGRNPQ